MTMNKQDLSLNELLVLNSEIRDKEKSLGLAYLMLIGGHLGVHRFYLKRTSSAIVQLILFLISAICYLAFYITFGMELETAGVISLILCAAAAIALFIWIVIDLFLLPGMVKTWNEQLEREIIEQIAVYRDQR
jgi:TM2 domain-containing membrane protein YozV